MTNLDHIKSAFLEAIDIAVRLPGKVGPQWFANNWPEYRHQSNEDGAWAKRQIRMPPPSRQQIKNADDLWDVFMTTFTESSRKTLLQWAGLKRNRKISTYCRNNLLKEHNYRRQIDDLFQLFGKKMRYGRSVRRIVGVEFSDKIEEKSENSPTASIPTYSANFKLHDLPGHPDRSRMIKRQEKLRLNREKRLRREASEQV